MAKTLNVSLNISGEAVNIAVKAALSNNALRRYELPIGEFAASATNKEVLVPLDISTASLVLIVPTTNVTLKTNSSTVPDDTKTLAAGQGFIWWDGCGFALSGYFSANITTGMFFTNSDADNAGSISIAILDDSTV